MSTERADSALLLARNLFVSRKVVRLGDEESSDTFRGRPRARFLESPLEARIALQDVCVSQNILQRLVTLPPPLCGSRLTAYGSQWPASGCLALGKACPHRLCATISSQGFDPFFSLKAHHYSRARFPRRRAQNNSLQGLTRKYAEQEETSPSLNPANLPRFLTAIWVLVLGHI